MIAFADPTEWWLEVAPAAQAEQPYATAASRWNAYLNQICLDAVLAWIQTEYAPTAAPWREAALWEVVNGSAITVASTRLALIPTETLDSTALEVPQEWVDIPSWAADYYLAVQVQLNSQLEHQWVRVWGYTTHAELKTESHYDPDDRTYSLDAAMLTKDLGALWVTLEFCPDAVTKAAIAPLPDLSAAQAETLIQRLGNQAIAFPRLSVPFPQWGALLERESWRQQLYQHRIQAETEVPALIRLSQWLQQQVTAGWQSVETLLADEPGAFAPGFRSTVDSSGSEVSQVKQIELETPDPVTVALVVKLTLEPDQRFGIGAQLHPIGQPTVPANLELALLDGSGTTLQSVQAGSADNYIQLRRFRCPVGTRFSLQVVLGSDRVTEDFVV